MPVKSTVSALLATLLDPLTSGAIYSALLTSQGIDPEDVNTLKRTDLTTFLLTSGQVQVIDVRITNEVTTLEAEGVEVNTIMPSEYGIDMYPNVIFTSHETVAQNPGLVQAFVTATARGMHSALDNPEQAAELAVARDDTLDLEAQTEAMLRSVPLLDPPGGAPGQMQPASWEMAHQIMLEHGLIAEPLDLTAAYTLRFVENAGE